jgi:hypothetical protein
MAPSRKEVGELVAQRRGERSQVWLAGAARLDRGAVVNIEHGKRGTGAVVGARLQEALGGELLDYVSDPREWAKIARISGATREDVVRELLQNQQKLAESLGSVAVAARQAAKTSSENSERLARIEAAVDDLRTLAQAARSNGGRRRRTG